MVILRVGRNDDIKTDNKGLDASDSDGDGSIDLSYISCIAGAGA